MVGVTEVVGMENELFKIPSKSKGVGGALDFHISDIVRRFFMSDWKTFATSQWSTLQIRNKDTPFGKQVSQRRPLQKKRQRSEEPPEPLGKLELRV